MKRIVFSIPLLLLSSTVALVQAQTVNDSLEAQRRLGGTPLAGLRRMQPGALEPAGTSLAGQAALACSLLHGGNGADAAFFRRPFHGASP